MEWLSSNYQWLFSGAGLSILTIIGIVVNNRNKKKISISINKFQPTDSLSKKGIAPTPIKRSDTEVMALTKILFIDDDTSFKVVKILKNTGWINTKITKDIMNLNDRQVLETDIFFVDINGVGIKLKFKDEGLGLALALKKTFPEKIVVIYSTVDSGDRFHEALRIADDTLSKQADPYEFITIVTNYAEKKYGHL